ncbi:unnamed protein product [Trichogramma brassicae]|uniref:Uncharacterized protein n=1 Tax=Trichogramma brassicae TaxID=86971 RepID=A0A6H5IS49_9HYME|nr:unnamed protein product [Trichogramma brassicae]
MYEIDFGSNIASIKRSDEYVVPDDPLQRLNSTRHENRRSGAEFFHPDSSATFVIIHTAIPLIRIK